MVHVTVPQFKSAHPASALRGSGCEVCVSVCGSVTWIKGWETSIYFLAPSFSGVRKEISWKWAPEAPPDRIWSKPTQICYPRKWYEAFPKLLCFLWPGISLSFQIHFWLVIYKWLFYTFNLNVSCGHLRELLACSHRTSRGRVYSSAHVESVGSYLGTFYSIQSWRKCNHPMVTSKTHGKPRKEKSIQDAFLLKKTKSWNGTHLTWELWSAVCMHSKQLILQDFK